MKILIVGAGVVGTVYGWQLSKAGYDVSLFVRKNKGSKLSNINIECLDKRGKKPYKISTAYSPKVVEDFLPDEGYDLVMVCVKYNQLGSILPQIAASAGNARIMFMMNLWSSELIDQYLKPGQYFFAFPSVGGGKVEGKIDCFLLSSMVLGEIRNMVPPMHKEVYKVSPILKEVEQMFQKSGFKPKVSTDIMTWLVTHYVWAASFLGGVVKAGSIEKFAEDGDLIRQSYLAMREGFEVCRKKGYEVRKVMPQKLYEIIPLFILTSLSKKALKKTEVRNMVKSHISHSPDEMLKMYYDVLNSGKESNIGMPYYSGFRESVDSYLKDELRA